MNIDIHQIKDIAFDIIVSCSVLHTFLPPWDNDAFAPFPRFIKYYKVFIYVVGYVGINARSAVYKSISTETIGGVNESITNIEGPKKP